ncbi:MAG: hypothetical protein KAX31_05175, partial [Thermoplasmata archaeon]|nr:hypothetical protein [Thermoplasmata archaeon]
FPIEAVGNVSQVFDDSTHGDGGTAWDVIRWYDNFDKEWKEFATFKPSSLNDIDVVDNKFGFWINITSNTGDYMLTVGTGHSPIASVNINLFLGWNLVGYPSATARFGSDTLPPEADLVSYFDPGQPYLIHDEIPGSVTLLEGNAYWVHVVADTVWVVDL